MNKIMVTLAANMEIMKIKLHFGRNKKIDVLTENGITTYKEKLGIVRKIEKTRIEELKRRIKDTNAPRYFDSLPPMEENPEIVKETVKKPEEDPKQLKLEF